MTRKQKNRCDKHPCFGCPWLQQPSVAEDNRQGKKALLTAFVSTLKGHMTRLPPGLAQWVEAYRARGGTYSKALLGVAHLVTEGWHYCTRLEREWDVYEALGRKVPLAVDPRTGEVVLR